MRRLVSRRRERGQLLLWAAVFSTLCFGFWGLCFRATGDAIVVEARAGVRAAAGDSVARALAAGLRLLETGTPSAPPASYVVTPEGGVACVVTYSEAALAGEWEVVSRVATEDDVASLPELPAGF